MNPKRQHVVYLPKSRDISGATEQGFFNASKAQLLHAFGDPSLGIVNGFETIRWIRDIDGTQVIIYDHETSLDTGEVVEWRVMGKTDNALQLVTETLAERPI